MSSQSLRRRAPLASSLATRKVMLANRGDSLKPERILRSALRKHGLRFRKNYRPNTAFRCKADIVFLRQKVCVFVDGCFWHACPKHFRTPKTNSAWWNEKASANKRRDRLVTSFLESHGWVVLRVWEHDVIHECEAVRDLIASTLKVRAGLS